MRGLRVYDRNSQRYDFGSVINNAPITAAKVVIATAMGRTAPCSAAVHHHP